MGGAKLYKNFVQKLLAVSLCAAIVLLGAPVRASDAVSKKVTATTADGAVYDAGARFQVSPGTNVTFRGVGFESCDWAVARVVQTGDSGAHDLDTYPTASFDGAVTFTQSGVAQVDIVVDGATGAWFVVDVAPTAVEGTVTATTSDGTVYKAGSRFRIPQGTAVTFRGDGFESCNLPGVVVAVGDDRYFCEFCAYADGSFFGQTTFDTLGVAQVDVENEGETVTTFEIEVALDYDDAVRWEDRVSVNGKDQRIRIFDVFDTLPYPNISCTVVPVHEGLDATHDIEHLFSYAFTMTDSVTDDPLPMPLDEPVELYFEVIDGLDAHDLEVVLVQSGYDREFDEELVEMDGATWVKVFTDHFSPYALIDTLTAEEKAASDSATIAVTICVVGFGIVLVFALGIMLRRLANKENTEK